MTRVYLVFYIISLSFINFYGQDCVYDDYHKYIKEAKKYITSKKYDKAKKKFSIAFESVKIPLGKDLDDAMNLSRKTKDQEMTHKLAIWMAKGGIPLTYFQKFRSQNWYSDFDKRFSLYDSIYKSQFNLEYKRRITELIAHDIDFNEKYHDWRSGKLDMSLNEMISEAKYIATEFENLINEYDLPIDKKIGYYYDYKKKQISFLPIEVLIIHIHQRGKFLIKSEQIMLLVCNRILNEQFKDLLPRIKGFSDEESIEAEMTLRYSKFSKKQ